MPHPKKGPEEFVIVYDYKEQVHCIFKGKASCDRTDLKPPVTLESAIPGRGRAQFSFMWTRLAEFTLVEYKEFKSLI